MVRNDIDWEKLREEFLNAKPFNHVVIDNFFLPEMANELTNEFPEYESNELIYYKNALENKKVLNQWDKFPKNTYSAFTYFGRELLQRIKFLTKIDNLNFDFGLNGGGWHLHANGGNNNIHLDYNLHPKLGEQRKINIIVYMTENWQNSWGGGLEFWNHDTETKQPSTLAKTIENKFNRAIIFDTTQNSWHGLPKKINCPQNVCRKSLAGYYIQPAPENTVERFRVLFSPTEEQKNDPAILELIKKRSDINLSASVYQEKK